MILMNDFQSEPEELRQREMQAVERVLRSGWYVLGDEVKAFEREWARRCGLRDAVGLGNGMDAIEIGLRALGIGPGDEVITTPMTAFATVLAIFRSGAIPVLADIEPDTALLSIESVYRCISSKTKAVLLVHLYGQVKEMNRWEIFCKENNLMLLEDCAQAQLAEWGGRVAGSFGKFGAYSFYPTKNLGAIGDGGALVTDDLEIAECARIIRNYGQTIRYHHPKIGLNSRLDEIQAAILMERLTLLAQFTERRRAIAEKYHKEIINHRITLLAKPSERSNHVYHLFVLLCDERDRLSKHLTDAGISNLSHYPLPIHHQAPCHDVRVDPLGLVCAERHADSCLSIPCHPQMHDSHIERVIHALASFQ